uniref:Protochlorophyllide reductase n=1 Tax=Rhodosorus marinus TaxID=101924 RepID=A0A7S2ZL87_9RHOD|mmetsp:Transcript_23743/g.93503  ORF Transcript_23743/g.93503 Transcript_23743/m.93503 type:complete len:315 (+) Transcript_23743:259-1203(+)|eukprot:CAMPEP_0113965182 /NCGR_PEP_ID=MMETSP0011_2-20120614/7600_1 /TAXON_ID=101924 /ORGANISM="Rhodosorus marinus" /LENGTH=314 /DNA_ID=CAMNT_0000977661 /DNA_START=93 /DNA_END=1037 /DNA_ORIENTATION=+ /assembly_acc=CAM_ASM_000156
MAKSDWTAADIPDMTGKVAIVTGSNIGLGLEIIKRLAEHNATTIMAIRTVAKGEQAKEGVLKEIGADKTINIMPVDVSSLESVKKFANEFSSKYDRLDLLVENAGIMALETRKESVDGYEMQFATNHLGHFRLTNEVMPLLKKTKGSRVVAQSSSANWYGNFEWDNLNATKKYDPWVQYCMTKLANVFFAKELNARVKAAGLEQPTAYSAHPGLVVGQLQAQGKQGFFEKLMYSFTSPMAGTYETGARPALFASTSPEATPGAFYGPTGWIPFARDLGGKHPGEVSPNKLALDETMRKRLWEESEKLTKAEFKI